MRAAISNARFMGTRRQWAAPFSQSQKTPASSQERDSARRAVRNYEGAVKVDDINSGPTRIFYEWLDENDRPFIQVYDRSDLPTRRERREQSGRLPNYCVGRKQ